MIFVIRGNTHGLRYILWWYTYKTLFVVVTPDRTITLEETKLF